MEPWCRHLGSVSNILDTAACSARAFDGAPLGQTGRVELRRGRVTFVGAGPGAADLVTLRGAKVIADADVVVWASSLVHPDVVAGARPGAEIVDSAALPLEGVAAVYRRAAADGLYVARVHSGDPALWGAVAEQLAICAELGLDTAIVPGVSSFTAAAAAVQRELTVPELAQSVILTRLGGGKTPMPPGEEVVEFARHGTTMALFLSAARSAQLQQELLDGGYPGQTPCVVAYRVSWPDELVVRCPLVELAATVKAHRLWKHTLVLVGPALAAGPAGAAGGGTRSHLYHPGHFHGFRRAEPAARAALRARDASLARADRNPSAQRSGARRAQGDGMAPGVPGAPEDGMAPGVSGAPGDGAAPA
jgi:precorrin-4 C11-methyltransferase